MIEGGREPGKEGGREARKAGREGVHRRTCGYDYVGKMTSLRASRSSNNEGGGAFWEHGRQPLGIKIGESLC